MQATLLIVLAFLFLKIKQIQMKSNLLILSIAVAAIFLYSSCTKDKCKQIITYDKHVPVYLTFDELRNSVRQIDAKPIENAGKIFVYNQYLLVNEVDEGVHVFDNSDPANPIAISFINIPGNVDVWVRGNVLYADSYIDVVAIDLSDLQNIKELSRVENIIPERSYAGQNYDINLGVVVAWNITEVTEEVDCNIYGTYHPLADFSGQNLSSNSSGGNFAGGRSSAPPGIGIAGSTTRFGVYQDQLYVIDDLKIHRIDIGNSNSIVNSGSTDVTNGIETMFIADDLMFIGATNGMHIYSLQNPYAPTFVSTFEHVRSCDPVVVQGRYAYVTLRNGNPNCGGFSNQLDVIDIQDIYNPTLIKTYQMVNPHGLGIDGSLLFICDGDAGLKAFDATNINTIDQNLLAAFPNINSKDIIPFNNTAIMTGVEGIHQYDYTDVNNIALLSIIPTK